VSEEQVVYAPDVPVEAPQETETQVEEPKVDPAEEAQKLLKKVENLAKENKNLIRTQQAMASQFQKVVDSTVKQKLAELGAAKDEAIDLGDRHKVREIEQQMTEVQQQVVQQAPTLDPAIQDFVAENSEWFNKDSEMTEFAVAYNEAYLKRNPGNLEESLAATLDKVKKAFPEKFEAPRKAAPPSPVEGAGRQTSGNKYSISRLNDEQKIAYDQFVKRHKVLTHEQYFQGLDEAGYLA
jgi:exonuclease VII large subunit